MVLKKIYINCQVPPERLFIQRVHALIKGSLTKNTANYTSIRRKAEALAEAVYPGAANRSDTEREPERIMQDAFAGMIAEQSWLAFINHAFGEIAASTAFEQANGQIDIRLLGSELLEVRSSFVNNGIRFGVCHDEKNFNVIGAYSNLYKAGETPKNYYLLVLFETKKDLILTSGTIDFGLIAGATSGMLKENGYNHNMAADGDITGRRTDYRLLRIRNAHDIDRFEEWMQSNGYRRQ